MSIKVAIANRLNLKPEDIYNKNIQLKDVLAMSPNCVNSIDIMEAFVGAMADLEHENITELPVFTLDSGLDEVVGEIEKKILTNNGKSPGSAGGIAKV